MQGSFPYNNTMEDGYDGVSPTDAFPMQNKYGDYIISFVSSVLLSIFHVDLYYIN